MSPKCKSTTANNNMVSNINKHNTNNCDERLGLTASAVALAASDLKETPKKRRQHLKDLRAWLKTQTHLENMRTDDSFLLRFLRFQKFDLGDTKAVIDKYVHMRTHHADWFQKLDIREPKMREIMTSGYLVVLPDRDESGRRVIFSRAAAIDTSKFTACDIMRAHILAYETLLSDPENQVRGLTYVFDEREVSWNHISIWSPSEISKAFNCCERALPLRHQEIHFVHLPWTMSLVFTFAKNLLSQKLRERFQTHSNFDKLAKEFPSHLLPDSCGGNLTMDAITKSWLAELDAKRDEIVGLDRMRYGLNKAEDGVSSSSRPASRKTSLVEGVKAKVSQSSSVLNVVGNVRKMEGGNERAK